MEHDLPEKMWNKFRAGDDDAFSWLFVTYSESLYQYGKKLVSDDFFIQDCIQELFIKLFNNRDSLSPTNNPQYYLFKALRNYIIDALAKQKRITYISPDELPFIVKYQINNDEPEDYNDTRREERENFLKIINMTTPRQKEILYLRYEKDLSYNEIADILNMKYQSVRNLLHRALEKIRGEMLISAPFICLSLYIYSILLTNIWRFV